MRELPKSLRVALDADFRATSLRSIAAAEADGGRTTKTLFELDGGHSVEAVVMRYADRSTPCISSQAGCPVGRPVSGTGDFPFRRHPNAQRDVLVPINRKYPVNDLVEAAQAYGARTGRRVSYEWVMLAGVNDTDRDARELGGLLKRKLAHVNLIPFNPVEDTPYHAPDRKAIRAFKEMVEAQGINVTVRDTRGREADAACGQLHERVMKNKLAVS